MNSKTDQTSTGDESPHRMLFGRDLTIYGALEIKHDLLEQVAQHVHLELDLSGVGEIDTAGIQLLILAKRESVRRGGTLRIVAHSQAVHELIDFYNIAGYFGDPLVFCAKQTS